MPLGPDVHPAVIVRDAVVQEKEIEGLPKLLKAYRKAGYNQFREYNIPTYYNPEHGIPEDYLKLILNL